MSLGGFDFAQGLREVNMGLTNLGKSIEKAADTVVAQQRDRTLHGQEIAEKISAGIEKLITEIQLLRDEEK